MRIIKPSQVVFANDKIEKEFLKLDETNEIKIYIKRAIEDIKKIAGAALTVSEALRKLNTDMRVFCTQVVNIEAGDKDGIETVLKPVEMKTKYLELIANIKAIEFPTKVPDPPVVE